MPKLNLQKPICFIDLETTGTSTSEDRIVEIAILKVTQLEATMTEESKCLKINPQIPIPKGASDVHGITDEMVKDAPTFKQISKGVLEFIEDCDIAGFNIIAFDVPLLFNEFERVGVNWDYKSHMLIDVCNIFKIREERTLSAAVQFYCNEKHEDAHGAEGDNEATKKVFFRQLEMYQDLPSDIVELSLYSNYGKQVVDINGFFVKDESGEIIFRTGKHKGKVAKKEKDYLQWMTGPKATFSSDTKKIAQQLLLS